MKVEIGDASIKLREAQLLRLNNAAMVRIVCHCGTLWVTQEGVLRDDFLRNGETLTLKSQGLTLVQAVNNALLSIDVPPRVTATVAVW